MQIQPIEITASGVMTKKHRMSMMEKRLEKYGHAMISKQMVEKLFGDAKTFSDWCNRRNWVVEKHKCCSYRVTKKNLQ